MYKELFVFTTTHEGNDLTYCPHCGVYINLKKEVKMSVKAKFQCNSIVDIGYGITATFNAVYGTEGENSDYSRMTPCGNIQMTIDKQTKASEEFQRGKCYYLTFEEAPV